MTEEKMLELQDRAAERCLDYKKQGFNCAESSIRAIAETLDIPITEEMKRCATGFRGGGGGYMERCGIMEMGIVLLSFLYGRTDPKASTVDCSYLIRVLHERFITGLGSYTCRLLLPYSMAHTAAGDCALVYDKGARILTRLFLEAPELLKNMPEEERNLKYIWSVKY